MIAWFVRDIWHKYHEWFFKIISNFTQLTACEITYNNFEISRVVFMPNITTNHAITYTNMQIFFFKDVPEVSERFISVVAQFYPWFKFYYNLF